MRLKILWRLAIMVVLLASLLGSAPTAAQQPAPATVRAVLFYSPSCGHCHYVIQEVLPPLVEKHGDQLQIVGIDVTQPGGQQIYQAAIDHYQIPQQRLGVPTLIVGDAVLVGSGEIPEQLPGLIETWLQAGGVAWPAIPGFAEAFEAANAVAGPTPTTSEEPAPTPSPTVAAADASVPPVEIASAPASSQRLASSAKRPKSAASIEGATLI